MSLSPDEVALAAAESEATPALTHGTPDSDDSDSLPQADGVSAELAEAGLQKLLRQEKKVAQIISIKPFEKARKNIQQYVQENKKSLFVTLALAALAFKLVFGQLAVFTIFLWLFILFQLTRAYRLNCTYEMSVEANGIVITRRNWLGKDVLNLPWQKIESIQSVGICQLHRDRSVTFLDKCQVFIHDKCQVGPLFVG